MTVQKIMMNKFNEKCKIVDIFGLLYKYSITQYSYTIKDFKATLLLSGFQVGKMIQTIFSSL